MEKIVEKHAEIKIGGQQNQLAFTQFGLGGLEVGWWRKYTQQEDAIALVKEAYNEGVRVFDTANLYGATRSEWIYGRALAEFDRSSYTLSTKVGYDVHGYAPDFVILPNIIPTNFSYDFMMENVEWSLKRLNTDYLDIVHIHDTADTDDFSAVMNGAYKALDELKSQGVVRAIGFGNKYCSQMKLAAENGDFDAFLCACRYSLLDHKLWLDECQEIVEKKNIAIMAGGIYCSGLGANPYGAAPQYDYMPASIEQIKKAQDIDKICRKYGLTIRQVSTVFPRYNPVVKTTVIGTGNIEHQKDNVKQFNEVEVPAALWAELKAGGYIDERAFLPEE